MYYEAADVYALLILNGCSLDVERHSTGQTWTTAGCQVFVLPDPDVIAGVAWLDADVIDDNLRDRWTGLPVPLPLKRHPQVPPPGALTRGP